MRARHTIRRKPGGRAGETIKPYMNIIRPPPPVEKRIAGRNIFYSLRRVDTLWNFLFPYIDIRSGDKIELKNILIK